MTSFKWGLLVWLAGWVGMFLLLELTAAARLVPWPTLSRTSWDAEAWEPVRLLLLAFLAVLTAHICFRLSVAALIAVVISGAVVVAVHFAFGTP
jgi:hypothetical protein